MYAEGLTGGAALKSERIGGLRLIMVMNERDKKNAPITTESVVER
jgi:hypothetical protein